MSSTWVSPWQLEGHQVDDTCIPAEHDPSQQAYSAQFFVHHVMYFLMLRSERIVPMRALDPQVQICGVRWTRC
jgi:hypothetical protein